MRITQKGLLFAIWLLSLALSFGVPGERSVSEREMGPVLACEHVQPRNHDYDAGFGPGLDYDAGLPFVAAEGLSDAIGTIAISPHYDSASVSTIRVVGTPRAPPAEKAGFLAAKTGADSALQGARLGEHLRQLEKYGQVGFKELESGRLRYYGNINPATTPGTMAGRRLVREWDPSTGAARTWHETVDQAGRVRIVRPETGGRKVHYMFDEHGNYTGSF